MSDSIFTKIIQGEIPCHKIYEDEFSLAFLDIHPVQPGHTLVVSKNQIDKFYDLSDQELAALMQTVKKVAQRIEDVLHRRATVQVLGFDVPHAHIHVIPANNAAEFRHLPDMSADPDHAALSAIAESLRME